VVVLHGGVENLLDHVGQPVDLVDEEHIVFLQVREDRGQVALPLDDGPRGHLDADAHLPGQDVGERRLAETRGAREQDVVQGLAPHARRLDENGEAFLHALLSDVLGKRSRTERPLLFALTLRAVGIHQGVSFLFLVHTLRHILPRRGRIGLSLRRVP